MAQRWFNLEFSLNSQDLDLIERIGISLTSAHKAPGKLFIE
jgi:hypothetical protein